MRQKRLIVTAGLPGSGKSSVAEGLANVLQIPVISIDPIEAAMWRGQVPRAMTGVAAYGVAEAIADENLKVGVSVVVDAVNPVEAAREMWRRLGERRQVPLTFIECICSDLPVHRNRIEARVRGIPGMPEVTWQQVEERRAEYEPWNDDRIVLDTARESQEHLVRHVLSLLDES